jgi:hypothetical protein
MNGPNVTRRGLLAAAAPLALSALAMAGEKEDPKEDRGKPKTPPPTPAARARLLARPSDAVRTVPPNLPANMVRAPAAPKKLTYYGGPLLGAVEVVTLFWGTDWQKPDLKDTPDKVNEFFDFILTSALLDQLGEYSVTGTSIAHGKRTATEVVTSPALGNSVTDGEIQSLIQQEILNGNVPQPTANGLYFVYTQPGVQVIMGGSASCVAFCGYHDHINRRIFYAVMPYPDCRGCTGTLSAFDALTSTSSHELCEAITDAVPGEGWYDWGNNMEIGDLCAWMTKKIDKYTVQLEWSNKAKDCI